MNDPGRSDLLQARLRESADLKLLVAQDEEILATAAEVAERIIECFDNGGKLLLFGNGGSSMDAGHLAAEFVGRFRFERRPLPAISLSDATAAMTAIGNDYTYSEVFSRQIVALGRHGDIAAGLSTSGNSANVVNGLLAAQEQGLTMVAFTGSPGGRAAEIAEYVIKVPSQDTPRIQECHMTIGHTICELVEQRFVST